MLVQFDSPVGRFTMFGDMAVQLLRLMGHSGTIPSAILADDIPAALERLKRGLAEGGPPPADAGDEDDPDRDGPRVSLAQRAFPLIELLERAAADGRDVTWDRL
jgi:hypothetical protein